MVKLKKSTKNHELDINVAKTGNSAFFPRQAASFTANGKFRGAA